MADWYDNDEFWNETRTLLFNETRLAQAQDEVNQVLDLLGDTPSKAAILDMGCGIGRHALEFARKGFRVTGVDRTDAYLDKAKAQAASQGLNVEWVLADMRQFRRADDFDAAVNLLTSFGYFPDPAQDRCVVDNLFASLKPGGCLVMDLMGKEVLARIFQQRDWHEEPDGTLVLEEREIKDNWGWIDVRWTILRGSKRREYRFGHRLYSADKLRRLLADTGFTAVEAYGTLAGTPYDHQAERLVIVARKPTASLRPPDRRECT